MNPILQTILNGRRLLLLLIISLSEGLFTAVSAQTCPAGWTSIAAGTAYPVDASATRVLSGSLDNILFTGADGNSVQMYDKLWLDFGQTLTAGGKLSFVAYAPGSGYAGNFDVTFSTDGINFSGATSVKVPATVTSAQTYEVVVPQNFRYLQIVNPLVGNFNYAIFDAVSYQGAVCQAPTMSYASCGAGENQAWQFVKPNWAVDPGSTPNNVMNGPDGYAVALIADGQSIVAKYDKAFATGDTIEVSGYKYSSSQVGTFQVLTSMDGTTFTSLSPVTFTKVSPGFEKVKIAVTQPFQFIKVIRSGAGQVNIDAINVFAKVCVNTQVCGSGSQLTANAVVYPVDASATRVLSGSLDNILFTGADGNSVQMYDKLWLDFGQTLTAGGKLSFVAYAPGSGYAGNFDVTFSTDGINFSGATSVKIPATVTSAQTYEVVVPENFRYLQIVNPLAGNFNYAIFDAIGYWGGACISCNVVATATVTSATCATGTSGDANADGAIRITTFGGGATKVGYSTGSSYSGPSFASATTLTTAPFTVANTLSNPTTDQPYTVRVFGTATCYQDYVVTLNPKLCLTADLSLAVSPATAGGSKGEQVTYTYTLTNAGPNAAPNVTAFIAIPSNTTFLSATTSQGTFNSGTTIWNLGTVPVGSQTIVLTLQMK